MDNSIITKIKNELDIVDIVSEHVDLSKKGKNYWGLCPFHEDSNPSMSVSPEKQLYKCFVCQNGGDLIKFTSEINNITFPKAISQLAKKIGIEYNLVENKGPKYTEKQQKFIDIHRDAMNFYQYSLSTEQGKKALDYILARGLNHNLIEVFSIGYAPEKGLKEYLVQKGHDEADIINASLETTNGSDFFKNRLIFGIKNNYGDIISFSARDLTGNAQAKYINSSETQLFSKNSILYNFSDAKETIKKEKQVYINEGFMDVIAMYRAGIRNSVAIMGTALTDNHARLLNGFKVNLMLDGDKAGISATIKSIKMLLKHDIETFVVKNMSNKDPDEIISSEGIESLIEVTNNKVEALEFIYELHKKKYSNITPTTALEFTKSFSRYLINSSLLQRDFYINKLSKDLGISKEVIEENISSKRSEPQKEIYKREDENKGIVVSDSGKKPTKSKNNTYKLIKSMIRNNNLIDLYKENKPYLIDPILISLTNYMIDAYERKVVSKPSVELKVKFNEIDSYDDFVNTDNEFKELIKRVTSESYEWEIESNKVKLKGITDESQKAQILQDNIKLKQELRKNEEK